MIRIPPNDIWDKVRQQMSGEYDMMQDPNMGAPGQPPFDPNDPNSGPPAPPPPRGQQYQSMPRQVPTPQDDADDPFADQTPEEWQRTLNGAYEAGRRGETEPFDTMFRGPYAKHPKGMMLKRAYDAGRRDAEMGRRRPR